MKLPTKQSKDTKREQPRARPLPLSQLAEELGFSISKLHRLVASKQIPHLRIGARRDVYFERADVEAWLTAQRVEAAGAPASRRSCPDRPSLEEELETFGMTVDELTFPH